MYKLSWAKASRSLNDHTEVVALNSLYELSQLFWLAWWFLIFRVRGQLYSFFFFNPFWSKNFDAVSSLKYLLKIIWERFQIQYTLIIFYMMEHMGKFTGIGIL